MIRMLGAVCLAAGPVWLGMSAAAELAHRERALGALCAGLELMERELALRLTPLPQLMEELAHRTEEPARRLFSACRRALDGLERETFAHAWRRLTDQLPVSPEAKRALYPWGRCWGAMTGGDSRRPSPGPGGSWRDCGPGPGRSVSGWERCTGPWG